MSWLARSMLRTKGFYGSEQMGTGMRPSPRTPHLLTAWGQRPY